MPRILVVDDDDSVRELIELALDGLGHAVDSAGNGHTALEQLARHAYDLVLCDVDMPDVDGRVVYRAIQQQPPPRPAVVFITGYAVAGAYEEFFRTAQAPVLGKPFEINVLRHTVRRMLGGA
jgi:CheY-like chemotaxis protein